MRFCVTAAALLRAFTLACGPAFAEEPVTFSNANGDAELTGYLSVPGGAGPFPAAVFLHGCSGLQSVGGIFGIYRAWADHLGKAGCAVLMVDSTGSRGFGQTCGPSEERTVMYRERPGDAYGALAYLQSRPDIDPARVSLIGWSQGGGIVLLSIASRSIGRPEPPPEHDFRSAIAIYPAACSDTRQSEPNTGVPQGTWAPVAPFLVLQGGADNWTRPESCVAFIDSVKARGYPAEIVVYPGAYHAFDAPDMPLRERQGATTPDGRAPIIGTNEAARNDALDRVVGFLGAAGAAR